MKKSYALSLILLFLASCATKPISLEEKSFSSESAFKVISEVNQVIPHIQGGEITVKELSEILSTEMNYDLSSGDWVAELSNYKVTARFDGELKEENTALHQVKFQIVPQDFLSYSDVQEAFGQDYETTRYAQTVVIRQSLPHAKGVEFLVHLPESASEPQQPVKSLLLRPQK